MPWTPTIENKDSSLYEFQPHFKVKCQLTETDILGLIRDVSYSELIVDYLEITDNKIERLHKDLTILESLKCNDSVQYYETLLEFQFNLNSKVLKLDRKVLFLQKDNGEFIDGEFKIMKDYKYNKEIWWLFLMFIFVPDIQQLKKMNDYKISQEFNKVAEHNKVEKQLHSTIIPLCPIINEAKAWKEVDGSQLRKKEK